MEYTYYKTRYAERGWKKAAKARREKRKRLGISQRIVAERLGVQGATISRWESGCIRPGAVMERAWDDALFTEAK